jgi:hypothetical protein
VLSYASVRDSLLLNRYRASIDQIGLGKKKAPFAYVVPQQQRDPVAAVEMLRRLAFGGVRVSQLTAAVAIDGETFPAGTWIIPTDQEFAALAREVLDVQRYPDLRQYPGGPPERPYDAAGWTLPLQMGVRVVYATSPLADEVRAKMKSLGAPPEAKVKPSPYDAAMKADAAPFDSAPGAGFDGDPSARAIAPVAGRVSGSGPVALVDPAQNTLRAINNAQGAARPCNARAAASDQRPLERCRRHHRQNSGAHGTRECGYRTNDRKPASAYISRPAAWTKADPLAAEHGFIHGNSS